MACMRNNIRAVEEFSITEKPVRGSDYVIIDLSVILTQRVYLKLSTR